MKLIKLLSVCFIVMVLLVPNVFGAIDTPFFGPGIDNDPIPAANTVNCNSQTGTIQNIICKVGGMISSLVPLVMSLAVLCFFWGLAKFILAAGNEGSKAEGKNIMMWGIVALFVMVSVWGLVALVKTTFGVQDGSRPSVQNLLPTN